MPVLYLEEAYYVFSGYGGDAAIGRMDDSGQWTKAGELNQARWGHNAIFDGQNIIVVGGNNPGGNYPKDTERCRLQNDTITCTTQEPTLDVYWAHPELFLVSDEFCKG